LDWHFERYLQVVARSPAVCSSSPLVNVTAIAPAGNGELLVADAGGRKSFVFRTEL